MVSFHDVVVGLVLLAVFEIGSVRANFGSDFSSYWAPQNYYTWNNGDNCALQLTNVSGSGIKSYNQYLYGAITMQIKFVQGNSAGTVTTYYMSSVDGTEPNDTHDEIDYEFLGNVSGQPYTIHTNLFANGKGEKEMQFRLWFDPTTGYNNFTIFWNPCIVIWYVNWVPIRVFKNYNNAQIGFPWQPMRVFSSIWDGDSWATQGGLIKIDWSCAPFTANYQGLNLDGCPSTSYYNSACQSSSYWFNNKCSLTDAETSSLQNIYNNYLVYDYCKDEKRWNYALPPECYQPRY